MNNDKTNIYIKDTNSDNIDNSDNMLIPISYDSYKPWHTKTAWIRELLKYAATSICCRNM